MPNLKQTAMINIAKDFSKEPAGRYRSDGPVSGQVFREDVLIPALEKHKTVTVTLDGATGYGSSFLEEAFGGLVRYLIIGVDDFRDRLVLVSNEDPSLIDEIMEYVDEEADRQRRARAG